MAKEAEENRVVGRGREFLLKIRWRDRIRRQGLSGGVPRSGRAAAESVDLVGFVQRAVEQAGGHFERRGNRVRVAPARVDR